MQNNTIDTAEKSRILKQKALELGYTGCGIIDVPEYEFFLQEIQRRNALFPHSAFFYDQLKKMASKREELAWAKSIVVALFRYDNVYKISPKVDRHIARLYVTDGRLPYSDEKKMNEQLSTFMTEGLGLKAMPATHLLPAKWSAVWAGLGKFRRNNLIYTDKGSWNALSLWLVDEHLSPEPPVTSATFDCPPDCNRCIEACPTKALSAPFTLDPTHCASYLSYESMYREALPPEDLRAKMGEMIYGCDICQKVCPHNSKTWQDGGREYPNPHALEDIITLENLATLDQKTFMEKIRSRFFYINEHNRWQWQSNAIRAMANTGNREFEPYIVKALNDENENVRTMAAWALQHLRGELRTEEA